MNKSTLVIISLFIHFSCNSPPENKIIDSITSKDQPAPPEVTVIANLPDSLQPKITFLNGRPKPLTVVVPNTTGGSYSFTRPDGETIKINLEPPVNKALAVLQNENGEPIIDKEGKPFIMGDGGKSLFTNFTTENGLALDAISCSIMDQAGNLWFGTWGGGVSRYDGKTFTNFTTAQGLASNAVISILEDKAGNIWFGTGGDGVSRYDGIGFTNFTTAQGLANNAVWSITEDKTGNLWFGTWGGGVSRYDGKTFISYTTSQGLVHNTIRSILEDKNGNLWFGTEGGGVSRYDGKSFTSFTTDQGLANNNVWCMTEDKTGNLWFGTYGGGVSKYDGNSFINFTTAQGLANNAVWSIARDKYGNIWFGTEGGGASRYDGQRFISFTTAQGLAHNSVLSISEDKTGNLWFGTEGAGVSCYNGRAITSFTTDQGLANNTVWSVCEDKTGNLWFGTNGGGVSRYDGKSFTSYASAQGLVNNSVLSICEDKKGNLWFGTEGSGVSRYDGKTFTSFTTAQGLADNHVWCITEDKNGNLWFGTKGGGVSRYNGQTFTTFTTAHGLAEDNVWSITEDKTGNIWFGTWGRGVSRYDGKTFTTFNTAHGLANNVVWSIKEDKAGNLWFGTAEGLSILEKETFKSFKIGDGLPDNFITNVIEMPDGRMAVGTNLGIALFNLSEDHNELTDIEIFNTNTGYPIKDVNVGQNCLYLDSKGIVWAGTGSEKTALVRFDYAALHRNVNPPALVIESIKIRDENICWYNLQSGGLRKNKEDSATALLQEYLAYGKTFTAPENDSILMRFGAIQFEGISKFYPLPENLVLPFAHNHISFEFAAIETERPFLVNYQYMLEGYDEDWSPVTPRSNASFGNIHEGRYTFKLKAQGANGVWSEPVTYSFTVLPPWYRTWWAYVIYALLFLLALRIFSRWRERQLRAEKEKLEKTVEERTEEVVKEKKEAERQPQRSDTLLLNILPEEVAEELKSKGSADAQLIDQVTVLFTDFKGFTQLAEKVSAKELVHDLHACFSAFDNICHKYDVEKIKTIGDSYMAAGGLPTPNNTHAQDVVNAALEMAEVVELDKAKKKARGLPFFEVRIGLHTGPVVAGIVGVKKFQYDIWGDTVNTASRMESSGEPGYVNISQSTYELLKDNPDFKFEHRGKIKAKNKGEVDMYFVRKS